MIMDPIGNISSYLSLVKELKPSTQRWIILREMLIALAIMLGFNYLGEYIFYFLDLSETTLHLSAGVLLFLIAIKILFTTPDSLRAKLPHGDPFIFPLAVPLIAGPGLLATILLYAHLEPSLLLMFLAIVIAWTAAVLILFFSKTIKRVVGQNGLIAAERLIGMVLVLIAVQRFLEGIFLFWSLHHS